jgi:hypothetical protein
VHVRLRVCTYLLYIYIYIYIYIAGRIRIRLELMRFCFDVPPPGRSEVKWSDKMTTICTAQVLPPIPLAPPPSPDARPPTHPLHGGWT